MRSGRDSGEIDVLPGRIRLTGAIPAVDSHRALVHIPAGSIVRVMSSVPMAAADGMVAISWDGSPDGAAFETDLMERGDAVDEEDRR